MKRHKTNFKLFDSYSCYVPDGFELFILCLLFLGGMLVGVFISAALMAAFSGVMDPKQLQSLASAVSYPVTFIPAMIYAATKSHRNEAFEPSFPLDGKNFGNSGFFVPALIAAVATLCLSFISEIFTYVLPPMPEIWKKALESVTDCNIFFALLMVSVFAPLFEEWLCRGIILRGLLHCKRKNSARGISPVCAIVISAAFFGIMHGNPWQAIPAFLMGLLFGYVYYKTGSLKLTMLMHCVNNTVAIILSRTDSLSEFDSVIEVIGLKRYCIIAVACCILLILSVRAFKKIPVSETKDEIEA